MRRPLVSVLSVLALAAGGLAVTPGTSTAAPDRDRLDVYVGVVGVGEIQRLLDLGVDRHELRLSRVRGERGAKARVRVEAVLSGEQADRLRGQGVDVRPKKIDGQTVAQRATEEAAAGYEVFRPYSGPGGLQAEYRRLASEHRRITKLVSIGRSVNGQKILAVKVTKNARKVKDGKRPAVLYTGAQHAREWITPEMNRRLIRHVLDSYGRDNKITRLVNTTELWFIPVLNPDGYDFTFTEGQRLWRKNLRDNNGDGVIEPGDGVDLNRNFPTKWGYDNEGSSPNPASETYRGPSPASEPETQALNDFMDRVGFEFLLNYHSAAELLLYGTGWQVSTPTPDDVIYETLAGDDENPAVPGYDPDISAELYTTNGDTDTHMTEAFGTLGLTPEMSTCEAASDSVPDDEWEAADCGSGFEFPDDEDLVQAEFEKNLPFALSVAESAQDPADPASVVGRTAPNFVVDTFEVSHGKSQTVAVVAKRELRNLRMWYRVEGEDTKRRKVSEWDGGERYGDENDDYYAEFRGRVRGAEVGDQVTVWFTGVKKRRGFVRSERFTYEVTNDAGGYSEDSSGGASDVLVIANEDYAGVNPSYPPEVIAPKYAQQYVDAVEAAGHQATVWDVDAQGVPHDLGVLSHYDAVVWYLGDNRLTQDPEDELTDSPFGPLPDVSVAERQQYLTLSVRDYLNEGGRLVHSGETAQYSGLPGISDAVGGLFYGLNGDPSADCVVDSVPGFFADCLILADDFRQYYLGAFTRTDTAGPTGVDGIADPVTGYAGDLGGPVVEGDNPLDEAGVFQPTSDVLPVGEFPQFASHGALEYVSAGQDPFAPVEGDRYAAALHEDTSFMRLTRTVDLTGATDAELRFQLSIDTEPSYDNVIVEAHTPGQDDWTTLPDLNGGTSTAPPAECEAGGFLLELHPFLEHYLGGADCTGPGTSGEWNAFTGSSGGWQEVAFDLSGFTGNEVELAISYVTDPGSGGIGAFVDDTRVIVDGVTDADGFEAPTSSWAVPGPPAGSPPNSGDWQFGEKAINAYAGTATDSTLLLGFGLEQLADDAARADLMERALDGLVD